MAAAAVAAASHTSGHAVPMESQIGRRSHARNSVYSRGSHGDKPGRKGLHRDSSMHDEKEFASKFDPTPYRLHELYDTSSFAMLNWYDAQVRRLNLYMFALSFMSLFVGIALLETTWDPAKGDWKPTSAGEFVTKFLLTINTLALLYFLVQYYRLQARHCHKQWFIPDSIRWQKSMWRNFALEFLICAVHPPPDAVSGGRLYDNTLVTFLVFRLYLIIRVIRDHCPVYKQRAGIISASFADRRIGTPTFNWVLTTRYFFFHYMWSSVLFLLVFAMFVFGYGVLVLERTVDPSWNFKIAMWNTAITMTTVGYGDYSPSWTGSQICQALAAFCGILLTSLTIFVVVESLDYSSVERLAYNRYKLRGISNRQRRLAARFIQFTWRFRMYYRKQRPRDTPENVSKQTRMYIMKNREFKKKLQHYRRQQTKIIADERKRSAGVPAFEIAVPTTIMNDLQEKDDGVIKGGRRDSIMVGPGHTESLRKVDAIQSDLQAANKISKQAANHLNGRMDSLEKQMAQVLETQSRILSHLDRWDKEFFAPRHNIVTTMDDPFGVSHLVSQRSQPPLERPRLPSPPRSPRREWAEDNYSARHREGSPSYDLDRDLDRSGRERDHRPRDRDDRLNSSQGRSADYEQGRSPSPRDRRSPEDQDEFEYGVPYDQVKPVVNGPAAESQFTAVTPQREPRRSSGGGGGTSASPLDGWASINDWTSRGRDSRGRGAVTGRDQAGLDEDPAGSDRRGDTSPRVSVPSSPPSSSSRPPSLVSRKSSGELPPRSPKPKTYGVNAPSELQKQRRHNQRAVTPPLATDPISPLVIPPSSDPQRSPQPRRNSGSGGPRTTPSPHKRVQQLSGSGDGNGLQRRESSTKEVDLT